MSQGLNFRSAGKKTDRVYAYTSRENELGTEVGYGFKVRNFTKDPIVVVYKDNRREIIYPSEGSGTGFVAIEKLMSISCMKCNLEDASIQMEIQQRSHFSFGAVESAYKTIRRLIREGRLYTQEHRVYTETITVSEADIIKDLSSPIVVDEYEIVIASPAIGTIVNPYSREATAHNVYDRSFDELTKGCTFNGIRIVDNQRRFPAYWTIVYGKPQRITPVIDPGMEDGVYIARVDNGSPSMGVGYGHRHDFDQAFSSKIVFHTELEALTNGNPEIVSKTKLAELETESSVTIAEQKLLQSRTQLRETETKLDMQSSEHIQATLKRESEFRKEKTEAVSGAFKMVAGIVGGVVAVVGAVAAAVRFFSGAWW